MTVSPGRGRRLRLGDGSGPAPEGGPAATLLMLLMAESGALRRGVRTQDAMPSRFDCVSV